MMRFSLLLVTGLVMAACQAGPAVEPAATAPAAVLGQSATLTADPPGGIPAPRQTASLGPVPTPKVVPSSPCPPTTSKSQIVYGAHTAAVDLAYTLAARTTGLSGRPCLTEDTGLVIGWDTPTRTSIWMPDMNFPIDVIFVRDSRIIAIYADAQPCVPGQYCPTFGPDEPVDYVLEVPTGTAARWDMKAGAAITLNK